MAVKVQHTSMEKICSADEHNHFDGNDGQSCLEETENRLRYDG